MVGPCVTVACFVGDVSEIDKNGAPLPLPLAIAIAIVIVVIDIDEVEDCSAVEE